MLSTVTTMEKQIRISYSSLLLFALPLALFAGLIYRTIFFKPSDDPINQLNAVEQPIKLFNNGNSFFQHGNYQKAEECFEKLLRLTPQHLSVRFNLGLCLEKQRKWHEAEHCFTLLLQQQPHNKKARLHRAQALQHLHNNEQAFNEYKEIITIDENCFQAHTKMGILYTQQHMPKSYTQAAAHLNKACHLKPTYVLAQLAYADLLLWQEKSSAALAIYHEVAKNHQSAHLYIMIAQQLEQHRLFQQAEEYYKKALVQDPKHVLAHLGYAGNCFARGDYEHGLQHYEWRWHFSNMKNLARTWDGSNPKGKTILLLGENGFNAIVQFIRFAKTVKESGARVVVRVPTQLASLLHNCPYIDQITTSQDPVPSHDAICSIQSIPFLTKIPKDHYPKPPYLWADKTLVEIWRKKLETDPHVKIGLCWAAENDEHSLLHKKRSIPAKEFTQLYDVTACSFYALQKNNEITKGLIQLDVDSDTKNGSFTDIAALIKNLDLVITIDSVIAHISGALNVPTLLLLPYSCNPHWMIDSPTTFWYTSITIFRQKRPGDWVPVFAQVKQYLTTFISRKK